MSAQSIVERLRKYSLDWRDRAASKDVVLEAADTIEALFTALEDFDNWFCGFNPDCQASRFEGRKVVIRARAALAKAKASPISGKEGL